MNCNTAIKVRYVVMQDNLQQLTVWYYCMTASGFNSLSCIREVMVYLQVMVAFLRWLIYITIQQSLWKLMASDPVASETAGLLVMPAAPKPTRAWANKQRWMTPASSNGCLHGFLPTWRLSPKAAMTNFCQVFLGTGLRSFLPENQLRMIHPTLRVITTAITMVRMMWKKLTMLKKLTTTQVSENIVQIS